MENAATERCTYFNLSWAGFRSCLLQPPPGVYWTLGKEGEAAQLTLNSAQGKGRTAAVCGSLLLGAPGTGTQISEAKTAPPEAHPAVESGEFPISSKLLSSG